MVNPQISAPLLLDCSLSLINRTGAHYIAEELSAAFANEVTIRRYRLLGPRMPGGLPRKLLGRAMLRELRHASGFAWLRWPEPRQPGLRRVFLDPLYVLRSRLAATDVVLCHDVGPVSHPALYDGETTRLYAQAYAKVAAARPGMVFVSQASRRAFTARFGTDYRFLRVIPLYVREGAVAGEAAEVPLVGGRFFLTVGALERRKNLLAAVRGFAASGLHREGYGYVLCGARGDAARALLDEVRRTPGVHLLGYVRDAELRWLYQRATGFVLPSLLEGFGMPALEAAQFGLPPILSRDSALSEAVGGLCVAVDPESPAEIARAMRELAGLDGARRESLREELVAHARGQTRARFLAAWRDLLTSESRLLSAAAQSPSLLCEERSG